MAGTARKTVCIVGAGPSGLVAAKTLLWDRRARDLFQVTVFESQPRVGGLWPGSPDDRGGLVHPQMLANQSRHTVQFSNLAWDEGDAGDHQQAAGDSKIPEFPRAWQVGQYLERYYRRYCDGRDDFAIHLSRRVARAEPVDGGRGGWHVWTQATAASQEQKGDAAEVVDAGVFDYLIVASGYFGSPLVPEGLQTAVGGAPDGSSIPVIHSSAYRDLKTLFGQADPKPGKILVVGGQFSGVEIAGTIANHLSSARYSPGAQSKTNPTSPIPNPDAFSVHHLIQRPYWVFPLYTSPTPAIDAPPFLPFDLTSYNLRKRPQPLADSQGHISVEAARRSHGFFRALLGTDQADVHPALAVRGDDVLDAPPYMAVSDTYLEHVRSGLIGVSRGRFGSVSGTTAVTAAAETIADDVAAVVLATGFSPAGSLSFFPEPVKAALHFDAGDARQSVALAFHGSHHPAVARLAFVGYYRSPYWGVMEMQARLAAALFASDAQATVKPPPPLSPSNPWYPSAMPGWPRLAQALAQDRSIERTLALRADPRASQFPMGDYLYLMHSFAEALGVRRHPVAGEDSPLSTLYVSMDLVTPAHYAEVDEGTPGAADARRSAAYAESVAEAGLKRGRFVARAVFRGLQGTWHLDRQLTSRLPSHPSGRFVGTAEFRLRAATGDGLKDPDRAGRDDPEALEYLYVEDGTFTAAHGGPSFRATRRYVWRYDEALDRLSVWFARTDDPDRADYLFHALQFHPEAQPGATATTAAGTAPTAATGSPPVWDATAGHLCVDDFYDVQYQFAFAGVGVGDWRLQYAVRGPKKDYTIDGTYRRLPR